MLRSQLTRQEAAAAVAVLNDLPIRRWELPPLSASALDLLDSSTVADAYYVVLAAALGSVLITCDGPLSRSHGHEVEIELVGTEV